MGRVALRLIVEGVVQGVGFRPFVHRLALATGVSGYVRNVGGSEVEIFIEGPAESVSKFLKGLNELKPPPAVIEGIEVFEERPRGLNGFKILRSSRERLRRSAIPPDLAMCRYCLKEILDPRDRRFGYAFNSCAWCGPRFSMMYSTPYDRENTAMRDFPLCSECRAEYEDVSNVRRYHAQGISCPACGPKLWLECRDGEVVECGDPIAEAARLIEEGYIVAVKGLGGYHIAALATDDDVVLELRRRKGRPSKPFAVMGLDVETLRRAVVIGEDDARILTSPQAPILLLPKAEGSPVSKHVSPGLRFEGVFIAYTPLHYLLLSKVEDGMLIMTSGNPHGRPMCTTIECSRKVLSKYVDYILQHNREIVNRVDDSVLRKTRGEYVMLRRGRGYAPLWVRLGRQLPSEVVAFGADIQSAGAVGFEDKAVLTQYVGELRDAETLADLRRFLEFLIKSYGIDLKHAWVVVDKHPNYLSRSAGESLAREWGVAGVVSVQHHYAHALATTVDRGLLGRRVVAVVMDGTGYGDDGQVWGGEILALDEGLRYVRAGHIRYAPLVGGDASVERPARYLLTALASVAGGEEATHVLRACGAVEGLPGGVREAELLLRSVEAGSYVMTSSTGRFLDAASALLGICLVRTYEGEPAIRLESAAYGQGLDGGIVKAFKVLRKGNSLLIDPYEALLEAFRRVWVERSVGRGVAARSLLEGLGRAFGRAAAEVVREFGADAVVLGGGAAVNEYLVKGVEDGLRECGVSLKPLLPRKVPPGDGGVALGQVAFLLSAGFAGRSPL